MGLATRSCARVRSALHQLPTRWRVECSLFGVRFWASEHVFCDVYVEDSVHGLGSVYVVDSEHGMGFTYQAGWERAALAEATQLGRDGHQGLKG